MPTMRDTRHHRGFTLIELLLSLAMGTVIILLATASFRLGLQSMHVSQRMSLNNELLRTAFQQACDEVDYWTMQDDPGRPDRQPLRGREPTSGAWKPFTPFATSWPARDIKPAFARPGGEREGGWHPSPLAWDAADARTWCRANAVERRLTDLRFGDHALLSLAEPGQSIHDPSRCRGWYDHQVRSLTDALGFYGLVDYLPSNALLIYHGAAPLGAPTALSAGGMPIALLAGDCWLCLGYQSFLKGRHRATDSMVFALPNLGVQLLPAKAACKDPFRVFWRVGYGGYGDRQETVNFHHAVGVEQDMMPVKPHEWPELTVRVERFVRQSRTITMCYLDVFNPVTGELYTLPFSTCGTTLRGARQQRIAAASTHSGWSTYDNRDPLHPGIGGSLDAPAGEGR